MTSYVVLFSNVVRVQIKDKALYGIWCGVNRLGDSGVNRLGDTSAFVINQSKNQSIKKYIPHKLQSSTTYSRHHGSNVERGKLKCNTYETLSPIINYS